MGLAFLMIGLMGLIPGGLVSLMLLAFFIASMFDASKERPVTEVWMVIGLTSIFALLLPIGACFGGALLFTSLETILWIGGPHGPAMPNPIAVGIICFVIGLSPGLAPAVGRLWFRSCNTKAPARKETADLEEKTCQSLLWKT